MTPLMFQALADVIDKNIVDACRFVNQCNKPHQELWNTCWIRRHYQQASMRLHVWNRKMSPKIHLQSSVLILPTLARISFKILLCTSGDFLYWKSIMFSYFSNWKTESSTENFTQKVSHSPIKYLIRKMIKTVYKYKS